MKGGGALTQTSAKCSANVCYRRGVWRSRPATSGAVVVMLFEKVKMFAGYDKPGDLWGLPPPQTFGDPKPKPGKTQTQIPTLAGGCLMTINH